MTLQHFDFARRQHLRPANARFDKSDERVKRLKFLAIFAAIWVLTVIGRLISLQVTQGVQWQRWATKQHETGLTIAAERGPIYDRDKRLLAVSVPAASLFLRPQAYNLPKKGPVNSDQRAMAVSTLVKELGGKSSEYEKLIDSNSPFVWLKRQMPRQAAERIVALNIPGIGSVLETKRYYPYNYAASTVIGRVGIDGNGLSGLEKRFDRLLDKSSHKWNVGRDALGNYIHEASDGGDFELPRGKELQVSIDAEIQTVMDDELEQGRLRANSKAALGVMINARTGEILALGQSPMPNFNLPVAEGNANALRNLVTETVLEPGSIMKPLVVASALERGTVRPTDLVNCEQGKYKVGKHTVRDVHPSGVISVADVVVRSSNIGMTKIGFMMGKEALYDSLRRLGFGTSSGLNIPGESAGIFRNVSSWATIDVATHSFGQGIAVTPLQVVRAVGAIANGGVMMPLSLVSHAAPSSAPVRLFSEKVANQVSDMMVRVVEDDEHGTGAKARLEGVRIGGKTGTAQKARSGGRGYQAGAYTASFVGFIDAKGLNIQEPLVLLVMIDEPRTDTIYGGMLAAPVFQKITQRTLKYLSMQQGSGESEDNSVGGEIKQVPSQATGIRQVRTDAKTVPVTKENKA